MKKKLLSVLLAVLMIVTMIPVSSFADETEPEEFVPTVVNGEYVDGVWQEGGDGSITYDNGMTLSKTAKPVEGMPNCYDITLKVETSTTKVQTTSAVVLVIDASSSMQSCANCGTRSGHSSSCTDRSKNRLEAAQEAAIAFVNSYAGNDTSAVRDLAIVTFGRNSSTVLNWTNVAASKTAAINAINGIVMTQGTNMDAGLNTANNLLDAKSTATTKHVVLLSDGAPTLSLIHSTISAQKNRCDEAANKAALIKAKADALYTVCFGAARDEAYNDVTVSEFLANRIASSDCAFDANNTAELNSAFAQITESIENGINGAGATVTDPMADKISVQSAPAAFTAEDGTNYQWKLSNAKTSTEGNVTTYVYELTYTIKLNVYPKDFNENSLYPTNGRTYLNLEDGTKLEFPVPGVTGSIPRESFEIKKIWDDNNNVSGFRTDDAQFILKSKGDVIEDQPFEIKKAEHAIGDNEWVYVVENARIHDYNGNIIEYYVEEILPEGSVYNPVNDSDLVIRNLYVPETTSVTVTKVWDDNNNNDGFRPESLTVKLFANGVDTGKTVTLNEGNQWTDTFAELLKYSEGEEIDYTVEEDIEKSWADKYTAAAPVATEGGYSITNSHTDETIDLEITKIWADNKNNDGKRPASIKVEIYKTVGETATLVETVTIKGTAEDTWTYTRESLPKYEAGTEIVYTVKEVAFNVEGNQYVASYEGNIITNTLEPNTVDIPVKKVWDDNSNEEGFRPDEITVNLLNGEKVVETVALSGEGDEWTGTFKDLPKYKDGNEIAYTVEEVKVDNYTTEITGSVANGFVITNSREVEKTEVTVTKVWVDDNNRDGIRPTSITVNLLANDTQVVATTELTDGNLTFTFDNLNVYKDGKAIQYTVEEVAVEGYESAITGTAANGYTITNTHAIETTTVSGTKTWVDDNNRDGIRPDSITVNLLANGEEINEAVVTPGKDGNWAYTFENLPVNENGVAIEYTVTEDTVTGYEAEVNEFDITNTHEVELKDITVTKTWDDDNNRDGIRPDSITVNLYANGVLLRDKTATFGGEGNEWTYTFEGLFVNDNGEEIEYTIEEADVEGYEKSIDGFAITNTHAIEVIDINVEKVWNDDSDRDGIRPENLGIVLYDVTGEEKLTVDSKTLNDDNDWKDTFEDLPVYKDGGVVIEYEVAEVVLPDGYTSSIVKNVGETAYNFTITNKHAPELVEITVVKEWLDDDDNDGFRPESIEIALLADGEATGKTVKLNADNAWTATFTELFKYNKGEEIVYTVYEEQVNGYNEPIYSEIVDGVITVTNERNVEYLDITVTKDWQDEENVEGFRPESVTVNLLANGEVLVSEKLNEDNNWTYTFEGLDMYADAEEITYEVTEDAVENYKEAVISGDIAEGFTVINSRDVEKVDIEVTKVWADEDDRDGARPTSITVELYANDVATGDTIEITGESWTGKFEGYNKFADGKEIKYTVKEILPEDSEYTDSYEGNLITNTYEPKKTEVTVTKVWEDDNNRDGIRPESIIVNLLANGEATTSFAELSEENQWTYTFEDLYVFENKEEIVYSVAEIEIADGYTADIAEIADGVITITNTHEIELTEITVTKVWEDDDNNDGIRPESVTVKLLANGEQVASLELNEENQWTATFAELPVYTEGEVGVKVEYTFEEVKVNGYESEFSEIVDNKVTLTNTHENELTSIIVEKVWADDDNNDGLRADEIAVQLYADNEKLGDYVVLSAGNNWTYEFKDLLVFNGGELVEYTVLEADVEGYEASYESKDGKIVITNTHENEMTDKVITKVWEDQNDEEGKRPDSVEIEVYANGELLETVKLTAEENWTYTYSALKYADGVEIEYTIKEINVAADYEAEYDQANLTVTNTLIKKVPQTGDYTNMNLYFILAAVSLIGFGATVLLKKREEN